MLSRREKQILHRAAIKIERSEVRLACLAIDAAASTYAEANALAEKFSNFYGNPDNAHWGGWYGEPFLDANINSRVFALTFFAEVG